MKLIALVLGLFIERLLTHLLHLRELRWFDAYFDWACQKLRGVGFWPALAAAAGILLLPVVPVLLISIAFGEVLLGLPYLGFAVLLLLVSLGPRDLGEEVNEYCEAVERGDMEHAQQLARDLLETEAPTDRGRRELAVEEAILVQANNRIFGVVLWFIVLGPVGAWLFRVSDLLRRRAVANAAARLDEEPEPVFVRAVQYLHGALSWVPARLVALGFAMAGSFEDAVSGWRGYYEDCAERFFDINDDVVACVGKGALMTAAARPGADSTHEIAVARSAMRLVMRTLFIWVTAIALMTLFGWAI